MTLTIAALGYIGKLLNQLGVPYSLHQWNAEIPSDYYFVGTYSEVAGLLKEETGLQECTFILRGFTRKDWLVLERAKALIERNITKTLILENGNGLSITYDNSLVVPTYEAELKSIQINLTCKEWSVN